MQGLEGALRNPAIYFKPYGKAVEGALSTLNERVQRHVLTEWGVKNVEQARMAGLILEHQKLTWNWRQVAKDKVLDKGNLDAVGNVLRKYFETKGDMTAVLGQVGEELFLAVPVVGQIKTAAQGGPGTWVMLGLTIYFPALGQARLAYSLGEHVFAIHDILAVAPVQDNVIDAIYRGFAGPEVMVFGEPGKPPAVWTDADEQQLKQWYEKLREAEMIRSGAVSLTGAPFTTPTPDSADWQLKREQEYERRAKTILPYITELESRKQAFQQMQDGPWMGNVFGQHAEPNQKIFTQYLLKDVPPLMGFFSRGVIDMRTPYTAQDEARRQQLEGQQAGTADMAARLTASAELQDLELRKRQRDLGDAYVQRAQELAQQKMPDFLYRLKRDSLYPAFRQQHPRLKEEMITDHFLDTQVDNWLNKWLTDNQVALVDELVAQGLLPEAAKPPVRSDSDAAFSLTPWRLPIDVAKLKARVKADMRRSRQLYLTYEEQERNRQKAARKNLGKAHMYYQMAGAGMWLNDMGSQQPLGDEAREELRQALQEAHTALRYVSVPRHQPQIETVVYKI